MPFEPHVDGIGIGIFVIRDVLQLGTFRTLPLLVKGTSVVTHFVSWWWMILPTCESHSAT